MKLPQFHIADELTRTFEGGYVDNPNDHGGETFRGIAKRYHKANFKRGWTILDKYTVDDKKKGNFTAQDKEDLTRLVTLFYRHQFWLPIKGDHLIDQDIANIVYDIAVNSSPKRAGLFLQKALNVSNRLEKDFKDVVADGNIGMKTMHALKMYLNKRNKYMLIATLQTQFLAHWIDRASRIKSQEIFYNGINKRVVINIYQIAKNYFNNKATT